MYVPQSFAEIRRDRLHDLMERESFALLISQIDNAPFATHLPLLLDRKAGLHGTLMGHLARANPQWKDLNGQPVLAVFSGPHSYISPSWYESQDVVPTWNYVAVHATGCIETINDRSLLKAIVEQSVTAYESSMPTPWVLPQQSYVEKMLDQIVGFRIVIESIEGKWKLSQNHSRDRQQKVIRQLRLQGGRDRLAIADLMQSNLDPLDS